MKLVWHDKKRQINLEKHGLDFMDADLVLASDYRLDIDSCRHNEKRVQSFAYVFDVLAVLTVVYIPVDNSLRIISFRRAKATEREVYHEWLENDNNDN